MASAALSSPLWAAGMRDPKPSEEGGGETLEGADSRERTFARGGEPKGPYLILRMGVLFLFLALFGVSKCIICCVIFAHYSFYDEAS